jgi:phosphoribosylamine--glycine ligase
VANRLNILLVGSGGREHALARRIAASPLTARLTAAPGNAGIAEIAECVAIAADDVPALVAYAAEQAVDLVVVGPEVALVAGLADRLAEKGIKAFGPNAAAALLEGSKSFMKDIVAKYGIPTASYASFRDGTAAKAYVVEHGAPIVIKADGLAAGKGVTIAATIAEAEAAIDEALVGGRFGAAGREIVIEEFMAGEEASYFALVDGETVVPLGAAQDHKAAGDGDTGPNTGGMGAYSPAPVVTPALEQRILDEIVRPLARGMVLMARLESDPVALMLATAEGRLSELPPALWRDEAALTVVLCAEGYPGTPRTGTVIKGIRDAAAINGVTVFHAGTKRGADGGLLASGGRVLNIVATGQNVAEAQARAYRAVDRIDWPEGFCRRDIGWRAIAREAAQ